MQENEIDLDTPDGRMNAWVFRPAGERPAPGVLLFMDAPGVREELKEMARAISRKGYVVLLPNLYYRTDRHVDFSPERLAAAGELLREEMFAKVRSLDFPKVLRDVAAMLDYLAGRADVAGQSCVAIGYCMSGRWVSAAAIAFPERFAAIASFYGTGLVTQRADSPHHRIAEAKGELYFAFAQNDAFVPASDVSTLRDVLATTNTPHTVEVYPDTQHGFAFRRGHYHPQAAERHWRAIFDLLERRLPTMAAEG